MMKRLVVGLVVVAVVLGGLGQLTARAQDDDTPAAWLGVGIVDSDEGVTVSQVAADSPADVAGLREGDVIEAVDGTAIESSDQLVEVIGGHAPGDEVTLTISWRGDARDVKVTLAERPDDLETSVQGFTMPSLPNLDDLDELRPGMNGVLDLLGVELSWSDEGVVVDEIAEDSPLAESGLQVGDVITAIDGKELDKRPLQALLRALADKEEDKNLTLTVLRDGEEVSVELDLSALDLSDFPFGMGFGINSDQSSCCQRNIMRLGVSYQTITAEVQAEKELPVAEGALVIEVADESPAAEAGIQVDDIITAVNDEPVDAEHSLRNRLSDYEAGDTVTLSILRAGETVTVEVELQSSRAGQHGWMGGMMGQGMMGHGWMGQGMMGHGWMGQGMMDSEWMKEFFENHPGIGKWFGSMPHGGMFFHFGQDQSEPDTTEPSPSEDAVGDAA